jgi:hypothetical protein
MRDSCPRRSQSGQRIQLKGGCEFRVRRFQAGASTTTGVVNQDVEAAKGLSRLFDEGLHLTRNCYVGDMGNNLRPPSWTTRLKSVGGSAELVFTPRADGNATALIE